MCITGFEPVAPLIFIHNQRDGECVSFDNTVCRSRQSVVCLLQYSFTFSFEITSHDADARMLKVTTDCAGICVMHLHVFFLKSSATRKIDPFQILPSAKVSSACLMRLLIFLPTSKSPTSKQSISWRLFC